jgi:hypothetical protein
MDILFVGGAVIRLLWVICYLSKYFEDVKWSYFMTNWITLIVGYKFRSDTLIECSYLSHHGAAVENPDCPYGILFEGFYHFIYHAHVDSSYKCSAILLILGIGAQVAMICLIKYGSNALIDCCWTINSKFLESNLSSRVNETDENNNSVYSIDENEDKGEDKGIGQ